MHYRKIEILQEQERLANAKVGARQQCVYEGPYENCMANQRKEHNVEKYTRHDYMFLRVP